MIKILNYNYNFKDDYDYNSGRREGRERTCSGAPKGGPKISRFFFRLPPPVSLFLSLTVCLLVVWWCLEAPWPLCTFGVLGLSCEAPAAPKPPGFHTTAREPKRAHLRVPIFTKTTKIHEQFVHRLEGVRWTNWSVSKVCWKMAVQISFNKEEQRIFNTDSRC